LGTFALASYGWWSVRSDVPRPDGFAGILIAILIWIAIGATAGLISGRFRDAAASWAAAVIGWWLAYQVNYTIFPGWPTSDAAPAVDVLYAAVFLLPFIAGGHLLGATVANRTLRRAEGRG
jgi:hypothetical protein